MTARTPQFVGERRPDTDDDVRSDRDAGRSDPPIAPDRRCRFVKA
jgi:hypothetical protein